MLISEERKQEIIRTFQLSFKHNSEAEEKVKTFLLQELRQADEMLGPRDTEAAWRIAIRNRIKEIEAEETKIEERLYESKVRVWNLITGIVIGLLIAGLANILF